jgi:hypothetical protein
MTHRRLHCWRELKRERFVELLQGLAAALVNPLCSAAAAGISCHSVWWWQRSHSVLALDSEQAHPLASSALRRGVPCAAGSREVRCAGSRRGTWISTGCPHCCFAVAGPSECCWLLLAKTEQFQASDTLRPQRHLLCVCPGWACTTICSRHNWGRLHFAWCTGDNSGGLLQR